MNVRGVGEKSFLKLKSRLTVTTAEEPVNDRGYYVRGYSLIAGVVMALVVIDPAAAAVPLVLDSLDRSRTAGAASYVASRLMLARFEAVKRSTFVALQFVQKPDGYWFRTYADGNGNGVLARDISRGSIRPSAPTSASTGDSPG